MNECEQSSAMISIEECPTRFFLAKDPERGFWFLGKSLVDNIPLILAWFNLYLVY
jgi:hypothetical protein